MFNLSWKILGKSWNPPPFYYLRECICISSFEIFLNKVYTYLWLTYYCRIHQGQYNERYNEVRSKFVILSLDTLTPEFNSSQRVYQFENIYKNINKNVFAWTKTNKSYSLNIFVALAKFDLDVSCLILKSLWETDLRSCFEFYWIYWFNLE